MLALTRQSARVRELAADADLEARRMRRCAARGRSLLTAAWRQPSALIAGAIVVGSIAWLWPSRHGGTRALRHIGAAIDVGTLVWRLAGEHTAGGAAPTAPERGVPWPTSARREPRQ